MVFCLAGMGACLLSAYLNTFFAEVKVGDTVEIFGQTQSVDTLAAILDTIPYELTCAVSKRVPRLYMENGKEIERSLRLL